MYVIRTSDIEISQDFWTGKWVATHTPTGVTSKAYDYGLVTQELLLSQSIPLYFESPTDNTPKVPYGYKDRSDEFVVAEFRESIKNVLIDENRICTQRLSMIPSPESWTASGNGYRTYGYSEEEAKRKLLVHKPYLKSLLEKQFPDLAIACMESKG